MSSNLEKHNNPLQECKIEVPGWARNWKCGDPREQSAKGRKENSGLILLRLRRKRAEMGLRLRREWWRENWESEMRESHCLLTDLNWVRGFTGNRTKICVIRSLFSAMALPADLCSG